MQKKGAEELSQIGTSFTYIPRTPISDITTDISWLYNAIAQYFIIKQYSIYDFISEIPEESIGDGHIRTYLSNKLDLIKTALESGRDDDIIKEVKNIAEYFGYSSREKDTRKMIETINNEEYHAAFNMEELSHVSITFHSSKGLEFDQVIVFSNDYQLKEEKEIYNHYVAVTRAKLKLIIVKIEDINNSKVTKCGERYYNNIINLFKKSDITLGDIIQIID